MEPRGRAGGGGRSWAEPVPGFPPGVLALRWLLKITSVDPFPLPHGQPPGWRVLTLPPLHTPGLPGPQPEPKSRQERKGRRGQVGQLHEGLA